MVIIAEGDSTTSQGHSRSPQQGILDNFPLANALIVAGLIMERGHIGTNFVADEKCRYRD